MSIQSPMRHDRPLDQELAERTTSLRALALCLVRDEALADDLVQETWLAYLDKPPAEPRSLKSWMAQVLRNLSYRSFQARERRQRREAAVARPEDVNVDPQELVERAEAHRRLVDAVTQLDEPFRSTVLLRFFEGLETSAIAEQQGIHPNTVRWRLREATERLRRRLDSDYGNSRATWCRALVPLAALGAAASGTAEAASTAASMATSTNAATAALAESEAAVVSGSSGATITVGGTVMAKKTAAWIAAGIVALVSTTTGIGVGRMTALAPASDVARAEPVTMDQAEPEPAAAARRVAPRRPTAAGPGDRALAAIQSVPLAPIPSGDGSITGTVLSRDGGPIAGVAVYATVQDSVGFPGVEAEDLDAPTPLDAHIAELARTQQRRSNRVHALTDARGEFALEGLSDRVSYSVTAYLDGWKIVDSDLGRLDEWPDDWAVHTRMGAVKRDVRVGARIGFDAERTVRLRLDVKLPDGTPPESAKFFRRQVPDGDSLLLYWYPDAPSFNLRTGRYEFNVRVGEDHDYRSDNYVVHLSTRETERVFEVPVFPRTGLAGTVLFPEDEGQERFWVYLERLVDGSPPDLDRLPRTGNAVSATRTNGYQFRYKDIAPGTYVLGVGRVRDEVWASTQVDIEEGVVARQVLELPPLDLADSLEVEAIGPDGRPASVVSASLLADGAESGAIVRRPGGLIWVLAPTRSVPRAASAGQPAGTGARTLTVNTVEYGVKREEVPLGALRHVMRFEVPVRLRVTLDGLASSPYADRLKFHVFEGEAYAGAEPIPALQPAAGADDVQEFVARQPGDYTFVVALRERRGSWARIASTWLTLEPGDNDVRLALPELGSAVGVTTPEHANTSMVLAPRDDLDDSDAPDPLWQPTSRRARVDTEGRVLFEAALVGDYLLVPAHGGVGVDVAVMARQVVEAPFSLDQSEDASSTSQELGSGR